MFNVMPAPPGMAYSYPYKTVMTQFESKIKIIPYNQGKVYAKLSDLSNLSGIADKIPQDKVNDLEFDTDSIRFSMAPVGKITLRIIEREPEKCIKFESMDAPLSFNLWIQIVPTAGEECKMKLTLRAELNPFIKGMVQKPLQDGLDKMAEALARITY